MTEFTLQLSDEQAERLQRLAAETGQSPEQLLHESVGQWLDDEATAFLAAANHVLQKNAELYRRLA